MNDNETNVAYELKQNKKIICGKDVFKFSKKYNWYETVVEMGNKQIQVSIAADMASEIGESVKTFIKFKSEFNDMYKTILTNCASNMVELANEWKEDEDAEITEEIFINRIDKEGFTLEIGAKSYIIYFVADDMFADHGVIYNGNVDDPKDFKVDIG